MARRSKTEVKKPASDQRKALLFSVIGAGASLLIVLIFVLIAGQGWNGSSLNSDAQSLIVDSITRSQDEGVDSSKSQLLNRPGAASAETNEREEAPIGGVNGDALGNADETRSPSGSRPQRDPIAGSPSPAGQQESDYLVGPPAPGSGNSAQQQLPTPPPAPPPAPPPDAPPNAGNPSTEPSNDAIQGFACRLVVNPHLTISNTLEVRISGANRDSGLLRVRFANHRSEQLVGLPGGAAQVLLTSREPMPPIIELIDISTESYGALGCSFSP
jgi:hypothetical protein